MGEWVYAFPLWFIFNFYFTGLSSPYNYLTLMTLIMGEGFQGPWLIFNFFDFLGLQPM